MKTPPLKLTAATLLAGAILDSAFAQTPPEPDVVQFSADTFEVTELGGLSGQSLFEVRRGTVGSDKVDKVLRLLVSGGTATRDVDFEVSDSVSYMNTLGGFFFLGSSCT